MAKRDKTRPERLGRDGARGDHIQEHGQIQEHGWPSRRFKRWPMTVDWAPEPPPKRIGPVGYHKVVSTVRALFTDVALDPVLAGLQDYCFQQGEQSNANARDRAFFFDVLTHDLIFFEGDRQRPIVDDLPIDPKIYDALPQMKASHYDLYRVDARGLAGGIRLTSRLRQVEVKAGSRLLRAPRKGDHVLGRVVQIGRGYFLDEPWLIVPEACVEAVVSDFDRELSVTARMQPGLTRTSLLKVAGYHLYECAASYMLRAELATALRPHGELDPVMVRFRVRARRELPKLDSLPKSRVIDTDPSGKATLVMVDLLPAGQLSRALREAMVTVEDRDLLVLAYLHDGLEALLERLRAMLPEHVHELREPLTVSGFYRALRHTLTGR